MGTETKPTKALTKQALKFIKLCLDETRPVLDRQEGEKVPLAKELFNQVEQKIDALITGTAEQFDLDQNELILIKGAIDVFKVGHPGDKRTEAIIRRLYQR